MPLDPKETKEKKESTGIESVDNLIGDKKAEKASEGAKAVAESAGQVQDSVADVMAGMEAPSEGMSEGVGERGEKGDLGSGGGTAQSDDDDAQQVVKNLKKIKEPSQAVMIKKVRKAIEADIKQEFGKLKKYHKHLSTGSAEDFNASVARIRSLKETLSSLLNGTLDFIKGLYGKYFTPEGQRRVATD